jgi:serine-type D-Ala-D-Ala carboxypeptidase/endopeptidase (penicillin-binding protein 4)
VHSASHPACDSELADRGALRRALLLGAVALACRPALATNLPSKPQPPRRAPLPPVLQTLLAASGLPAASFGLLVQPTSADLKALISLNADATFSLASTTKLVTTLAALDLLGPDYRWYTHAYLDGFIHGGRLLGDLVIVGGGDVGLSSAALRDWFTDLHARGLHEVWGDIVLDRLAFNLSELDHANTPAPSLPGYARPDALMLDEGVLRVALEPSPKRATRVHLAPSQSDLTVINRLTAGTDCSATAHLEEVDLYQRLVVRGAWGAACGNKEIAQLAMSHLGLTQGAVAELWREAGGGRVRGRVRSRIGPESLAPVARGADGEPASPWASLPSQPLSSLIRDINKSSANLAARSVFLSLASEFPLRPATLSAARERITAWLRGQGLKDDDVTLDNGSGLSPTEKGRPRALVQLLLNAWNGPHAHVFVDSLPIAGVDGTLWRRMTSGPATGQARLKTGTTRATRALAGYVHGRSGTVYAVVAIVNHPEAPAAVPVLDAIIEWVAANG